MVTINWTGTTSYLSSLTETLVHRAKNHGINWAWKTLTDVSKFDTTKQDAYFVFKFDWDELKEKGIDGFEATIRVSAHWSRLSDPNVPGFPKTFTFQLTRSGQIIKHCVGSEDDVGKLISKGDGYFKCVFVMTPIAISAELNIFDKIFAASDKTDAILVVEDTKLHVNKQFLSFHSDYFNTLFNSKLKEKSINEIPIEDVKYEDFARLLCTVYPNPINPNVDTFEILLELAGRFMMPMVTHLVELFLISSENVRLSAKLAMADKYSLEELMERCLDSIKTSTDVKMITETAYFEQMSNEMKAKLLYKTLPFL